MRNIVEQFKGYKTYLVGFSFIIYAFLAIYFGKIDGNTFADTVYAALGMMAFRSGMKTESERKANLITQKLQEYIPELQQEVKKEAQHTVNPAEMAKGMVVDLLSEVINKIQEDSKSPASETKQEPLG